ncbi:endolytic transglycosylase MltG [Candidatus Saccharibacteria bacterium]|nr:endolytic transglycosylase MltG [Candidatus Saccharibacteria bacterium]
MHRTLRLLTVILIIMIILTGALMALFIQRQLNEREQRRLEQEQIENEKAATFRAMIVPGSDMFSLAVAFDARFGSSEWQTAMREPTPLDGFFGRPEGNTAEGLIFPETYEFFETATPADVIQRAMRELQTFTTRHQLTAAFERQNLTLYEGIILASIVEREVTAASDREMVAGLLLNRLQGRCQSQIGNPRLGADPTFIYGWMLAGNPRPTTTAEVATALNFNSPYNTRLHVGLPPGPISNPSGATLLATANPSENSYCFFISDDDGQTRFARTLAEHQANIRNYCKVRCGAG